MTRGGAFVVATSCVLGIGAMLAACGSDSSTSASSSSSGGVDGSLPDSLGPVDSGPKDVKVDVAPPVFCKDLPVAFCAEWNGPTPAYGWDGVDARGGGVVELVAATETSPPKALRSALPAVASGANIANAQIAKKLALGGKKKIVLSTMARIGDATLGAGVSVPYATIFVDTGSVALFRGQAGWFVRVARKNTGGDDGDQPALTAAPPTGKWTRLRLEIVLARPSGSLRVDIDGQNALAATLATHGDAQPLVDATLAVGLTHVAGAIPAMEASFDDLTLSFE